MTPAFAKLDTEWNFRFTYRRSPFPCLSHIQLLICMLSRSLLCSRWAALRWPWIKVWKTLIPSSFHSSIQHDSLLFLHSSICRQPLRYYCSTGVRPVRLCIQTVYSVDIDERPSRKHIQAFQLPASRATFPPSGYATFGRYSDGESGRQGGLLVARVRNDSGPCNEVRNS